MPYMIILSGVPASGKTTFAEYLEKELGIPVISKDFIKEILYEDIGFQSRAEKVKLGIASMNIMYGIAEESMKLGKHVILENNFENTSKPKLLELIESYGYQVIHLRFEGDLSVIFDRFIKRDLSPERHYGHVTNDCYPPKAPINRVTISSVEEFKKAVTIRGILGFDIGGEVITVDTTVPEKKDYHEIIDKIRTKLEE